MLRLKLRPPFVRSGDIIVIPDNAVDAGNRIEWGVFLDLVPTTKTGKQTVDHFSLQSRRHVAEGHGRRVGAKGTQHGVLGRAHGTDLLALKVVGAQQAETGTSTHIEA